MAARVPLAARSSHLTRDRGDSGIVTPLHAPTSWARANRRLRLLGKRCASAEEDDSWDQWPRRLCETRGLREVSCRGDGVTKCKETLLGTGLRSRKRRPRACAPPSTRSFFIGGSCWHNSSGISDADGRTAACLNRIISGQLVHHELAFWRNRL
jgi:hypothetical protein